MPLERPWKAVLKCSSGFWNPKVEWLLLKMLTLRALVFCSTSSRRDKPRINTFTIYRRCAVKFLGERNNRNGVLCHEMLLVTTLCLCRNYLPETVTLFEFISSNTRRLSFIYRTPVIAQGANIWHHCNQRQSQAVWSSKYRTNIDASSNGSIIAYCTTSQWNVEQQPNDVKV